MFYFDFRAATINERNATGATSLVFTPSAKRSLAPVRELNNPVSENAFRNFLRASLHKFRGEDSIQPRSFAAIPTMISMLSAAKDIYSSISTRADSKTCLTVNLRNLTGKKCVFCAENTVIQCGLRRGTSLGASRRLRWQ